MKINKQFILTLKQKLTVGSTRSVLLNALPGRLTTRLPLTDLNILDNHHSKVFLSKLTTESNFSFKFNLSTDEKSEDDLKKIARLSKRLSAISYDYDDYIKEHGIETFGFGFPILIKRSAKDPAKFLAAPIFIFPLDLKQSFDKKREWIITRKTDSEIKLNEVLSSYLESEEHIKIPVIPEEMLEDGVLDKNELQVFCSSLLEKLTGTKTEILLNEKDILPEKLDSNEIESRTCKITWDGVFSIYKSQKQSQIKELEFLTENFEPFMIEDKNVVWDHAHSPETTDPSQNSVLRSLTSNKRLVIQGPPGTGKSQTLTAIIAGALANKKKVLVVCEKRTALEVIKSNLEKLIPDSTKFVALIEDVTRDRNRIVETVRNRTASYLVSIHKSQISNEDIDRFESKATTLNQQYKALRTPIANNILWKDLVSKWVSMSKTKPDVDKLFLLHKLFGTTVPGRGSLTTLVDKIIDAANLFQQVQKDIAFLEKHIIIPKGNPINDRELIMILKEILAECQKLTKSVDEKAEELAKSAETQCKNQLIECNKLHGELFQLRQSYLSKNINLQNPSRSIRIRYWLRNKYKTIKSDQKAASSLLNKINEKRTRYSIGTIVFESIETELGIPETELERIAEVHKEVVQSVPTIDLESESNSIEAYQQVHSGFLKIKDAYCKYINQNIPLKNRMNFGELKECITSIYSSVSSILLIEESVRAYVHWFSFFNKLTSDEKKWISELRDAQVENWKNLVENAWLYGKLMQEDKNNRFPTDESTINILRDLGIRIQQGQKKAINEHINNWFKTGQEKTLATSLQINQVYNLRGSKGNTRNSLRKIIHLNQDAFTDFFPVLMLNPGTCSSILPLIKNSFDIVMFDEASQLRIEDTFPALLRGRQIIVSGDSQQMPPSSYFESSNQIIDDKDEDEEDAIEESTKFIDNQIRDMASSESLLEFAIDSGYKQTYLDMHYRSRHPDLIEFSNICFYHGRLIPMPETDQTPPIVYKHVNGLYENRQNIDEAKEVVKLLRDELKIEQSIGVATFNLPQRNLILDFINEERTTNEEFNRKMTAFDANGFFVKNLENIQGDEKDIIIISTTFGINRENKFRLGFGPISQKNGHRLLNVIITRAKHKLYVLTSIPQAKISEYRQRLEVNRKIDGTTGLMAYLAYAKSVSENDSSNKKALLDFIKDKLTISNHNTPQQNIGLTESPFEEEVYNWLCTAIDPKRIILQYKCGGFRIDMVVLSKNTESPTKLAIECDGAAYHSEELAWHYDIYRQQQLEKHNFVFHRIWSTNWWRNPEKEFEKLVHAVNKLI